MNTKEKEDLIEWLIKDREVLEDSIKELELTIKLKKEHLNTIKEVINDVDPSIL